MNIYLSQWTNCIIVPEKFLDSEQQMRCISQTVALEFKIRVLKKENKTWN